MLRLQGSNSCPTSDLELRHLQVALKWWSKSCIQSEKANMGKCSLCMLEYRIYGVSISIFFGYVSSILCFCFLLSFGNSSASFFLDESKTLNF